MEGMDCQREADATCWPSEGTYTAGVQLIEPEEKESFKSAVEALDSCLDPGNKAVVAQNFSHATLSQ